MVYRAKLGTLIWIAIALIGLQIGCSGEPDAHPKRIAIVTLMSHPALDAVQKNAMAELARQGFASGNETEYLIRNANGQIQLAASIANDVAATEPDLIIALTTPMAQSVVKQARCPVVFAAVTDPVGAGLVKSLEKGEPTITGTSDAWPYEEQLKLIRETTPKVKRLGILFNPGEAASQYGIRRIRELAPHYDFELIEGACNTTTDVFPVAQNLAQRCDALFLSSDNTVIGGVAAAVKVATTEKLPLYVGDSGTVAKGGLAAVSVGYAELGTETGKLAARMLRGERGIPTVVTRGKEIYVNRKAAEMMKVEVPAAVIDRATKVFDEIEQ
jgi:putative ABC transport system substrate-binding protein